MRAVAPAFRCANRGPHLPASTPRACGTTGGRPIPNQPSVTPHRGPISRAKARVPTPTLPPSHQPSSSTLPSIRLRTFQIGQPVRACRPVIRPSRGPGPSLAPMYRPVARATSSMPAQNIASCQPRPTAGGSNHSPNCADGPINITLSTVPTPGFCRNGHHSSSTSAPITLVARPNDSGVCAAMPCDNTSQGATPIAARIISEAPKPYRNRPMISCSRRRGRAVGMTALGERGGICFHRNPDSFTPIDTDAGRFAATGVVDPAYGPFCGAGPCSGCFAWHRQPNMARYCTGVPAWLSRPSRPAPACPPCARWPSADARCPDSPH